MYETEQKKERVILVGISLSDAVHMKILYFAG